MPLRTFPAAIPLVFTLALATAAGAAEQDPITNTSPALIRFEIPAGTLADAVTAFETFTGLRVDRAVSLERLTSGGVRGRFSAKDALVEIVKGTGLAARPRGDRTFVLEPIAPPHRVETTGRLAHYVSEESTVATRTPTRLLDIPQTVHVVPRALLADQHAQSVAEALRNVPGVSIAQGEGNRDQVVLRGMSTATDFFVNGIRDDQERFRDLYNVESIEVVQGPAAVLFGRGGAGGVVNLVTTPRPETPSELNVEAGGARHKRATARVGASMGSNAFVRVNGMAEASGGFRDRFFLRRHAINPVVSGTLGAGSTLTLSVEHLRDRRLADRGIPSAAGLPLDVDISQLFGSPSQNVATSGVDSAGITFERRFGGAVRLRNSFLAGRYEKFYENVYPGSAVTSGGTLTLSAYNHSVNRTNVFNQTDLVVERRLGGVGHVFLAGFEAGRQAQKEARQTAAAIPNVPIDDTLRDADFARAPVTIDRPADAATIAGYVQDQVALFARWKAVAGVRVDRFSLAVDDLLPADVDLNRVDVAASPKAGLIFQPDVRTSIYGSYSYTFLPSGERLGLAVNTAQLRPESAENYELGAKMQVRGGRLILAMAAFRLDRNNVKSVDPADPSRLVLTGQQRTDGLTFSASGRVNTRWELSAGYATLDARITRATSAAPAGRRPGLVPRHQATIWTAHDVTDRLRLAVGVVSQAGTFTSFTNAVRLPRYTRVDATAFYRFKDATLSVGTANVFDARYYPTANGDNNISPGAPRTVLISLRQSF